MLSRQIEDMIQSSDFADFKLALALIDLKTQTLYPETKQIVIPILTNLIEHIQEKFPDKYFTGNEIGEIFVLRKEILDKIEENRL